MAQFVGYRAPKSAGGGLQNGYVTPRAKQTWEQGDSVNVGFVRGLEVIAKSEGGFALWQPSTGKFFRFTPHVGLTRETDLATAMAA